MLLPTWIGLLVTTLLCSAFGHPSQKGNEAVSRSVKTSSGRDAFESESSSLSHTELEDDGNDSISHYSEYEATAAESNHSNMESEFFLDSENGDMSMVQSNTRSESSSSSVSKSSRTEIEDDDNELDFSKDDLELSRSSKHKKSQKSSSSSYKSDSMKSIVDLDDNDDDDFANVRRKSSSFMDEKEFESETKESSFMSKDFDYDDNQNGPELKSNSGRKKTFAKESPEELLQDEHNLEKNINSNMQGMNTRIGIPENSTKRDTKKPSGTPTKKTLQNTENKPKSAEKQPKPSQKSPVINGPKKPSDSKTLPAEKKPIEKITAEKPLVDTPPIYSTPKENTIQMKEETKSVATDVKSEENKNIITSNSSPQGIQAEKIVEETSTSSNSINASEKISSSSTNMGSNIPQVKEQPIPKLLPALSSESLTPQLNSPSCQHMFASTPTTSTLPSVSPSAASNVRDSFVTTPSSNENQKVAESSMQNGIQNSSGSPITGTASEKTQASSISKSASSEYQQNTQYARPEAYSPYLPQDYGNLYPMYPYEKTQSGYPSYPINYNSYPLNSYTGCIQPYPLHPYPPPRSIYDYYGYNPSLPPIYMNHPGNPYSDRFPEYSRPQSPSIPEQNFVPTIATIPPSLPTIANNSPRSSQIPSVSTIESPLEKQRALEIAESSSNIPLIISSGNSLTTPELPQPLHESLVPKATLPQQTLSESLIPVNIPSFPELAQKPLSPSQELMINNHIPSYIIEDLEKRFEKAKIEILQKYTVYPEDMTEIIETVDDQELSYDYIVLGTQVGGLSALKALTETGKRVLLLDDARLPPSESYSTFHRLSLIDSSFTTSYSAKAPNTDVEKKIYSSKIVGGTLCYDLGVWDHGSMQKFEQWSQTCKSWSWKKIVSYYQDIENVDDIGYLNGPINISNNEPDSSLAHQIIESFTDVGVQEVKYDLESARQEPGLILLPSMYDANTNLNFAERMFAEVKNKENLHVALGVQALKIIFESDRAVGVEVVTTNGKIREIRVTEELIVAYGVVNTVKLLQQSGLGDASLLQQYQIPVFRNLPQLGKEVLLNPLYPGIFIKCQQGSLLDTSDSDFSALGYVFKEMSMQTSLASSFYKAFLHVQGASEPNIQINIFTFSSKTTERLLYFMKGLFNFKQEMIDFVLEEISDHDIMFLVPQLLDMEMRAEISISGTDYKAAPIIDTHLFESNNDMFAMQKTLSVIKKISKSSAFKEIGADLVQIPVKKCGPTKFSKEFNECSIRELAVASLHLTGGAIMGIDEKTSVVDEELRIHGIQNCRLLNSAVVPNGVAADSAAISAVIGRYGADMIAKKTQIRCY